MSRVWVAAAALAALLFAAPANAGPPFYIDVQGGTTVDERPTLSVTVPTDGTTVEVFRCPGNGACDPQPLGWLTDRAVDVSAAAPGDGFEVRLSEDGTVVATQRTPGWFGPPARVSGPGLAGTPVVGATLSPVWSEWSGGWGAPRRSVSTSLMFCRTPAGTGCTFVSYGDPVVAPQTYAGFYAFTESRTVHTGFGGAPVAVSLAVPPFPVANVTPGPTVAGPFGPIAEAPKPQPAASIRAKALRANGRLSVGRVMCPERCTVKLTVSGGGKTVHRTLTATGLRALTIPHRHGRLKVSVVVNGNKLASGQSVAR